MKRFIFDVKMFTTVTVKAPDETTARRWVEEALNGRSMGLAFADEGAEVGLGDAGIDGELDLVEEEEIDDPPPEAPPEEDWHTPSNPHGASKRTYTQQIEYDEQQENDDA